MSITCRKTGDPVGNYLERNLDIYEFVVLSTPRATNLQITVLRLWDGGVAAIPLVSVHGLLLYRRYDEGWRCCLKARENPTKWKRVRWKRCRVLFEKVGRSQWKMRTDGVKLLKIEGTVNTAASGNISPTVTSAPSNRTSTQRTNDTGLHNPINQPLHLESHHCQQENQSIACLTATRTVAIRICTRN